MPDASNTCEGDGRCEDEERVVPPPSVATQDVSYEDDGRGWPGQDSKVITVQQCAVCILYCAFCFVVSPKYVRDSRAHLRDECPLVPLELTLNRFSTLLPKLTITAML